MRGVRQARQARASIAELRKRINQCENRKKHLHAHLQGLKNQWQDNRLTYTEYEEFLNKKHSGKSIHEWFAHYEEYIERCKEQIKNHEKILLQSNTYIISIIT